MTDEYHLAPGVYENIPWSDYLRIPYMSPSTLKHGLRSMKRLKRAIDGHCQPAAKTTAVGQAVHCLLSGESSDRLAVLPEYELDPENLTVGKEKTPPKNMTVKSGSLSAAGRKWVDLCREYGLADDYEGSIFVDREATTSKSTAYYQAKVAEFTAKHEGRDIVTTPDYRAAQDIVALLMEHRCCRELIEKSKQEVTVIGEISGVQVKTRLDGLWKDGYAYGVWDLKTTSDIAPDAFYRLCKKLGYLFQFGFHNAILASCGVQIQQYDAIAAEMQDDFDVGVIQILPFSVIDTWSGRVEELLDRYRVCRGSDDWPGLYPDDGEQGVLAIPDYDMQVDGDEMVEFMG